MRFLFSFYVDFCYTCALFTQEEDENECSGFEKRAQSFLEMTAVVSENQLTRFEYAGAFA